VNALIVYNGRDNTEDLVLLVDGAPMALTSITRITLAVGGTVVDSAIAPSAITWPHTVTYRGASANAVRFKLGAQALAAGIHADCRLVIYEPAAPAGLVWSDGLSVRVKA
jgi:hypothetical protein